MSTNHTKTQRGPIVAWSEEDAAELMRRRNTREKWTETCAAFPNRSEDALHRKYAIMRRPENTLTPATKRGRPRGQARQSIENIDDENDESRSSTVTTTSTDPIASRTFEHFQMVSCRVCDGRNCHPEDKIVICEACKGSYHQTCHEPQVDKDSLDSALPWFCTSCTELAPISDYLLEKIDDSNDVRVEKRVRRERTGYRNPTLEDIKASIWDVLLKVQTSETHAFSSCWQVVSDKEAFDKKVKAFLREIANLRRKNNNLEGDNEALREREQKALKDLERSLGDKTRVEQAESSARKALTKLKDDAKEHEGIILKLQEEQLKNKNLTQANDALQDDAKEHEGIILKLQEEQLKNKNLTQANDALQERCRKQEVAGDVIAKALTTMREEPARANGEGNTI